MKLGISLNIDVTKIEKARIIEGKKGKYLNATVFVDPENADEYGNHGMITQDVTKEERDAGTKGPILGNVKVFWKDSGRTAEVNQPKQEPQGQPSFDDLDDDLDNLPF